MALVRIRFAIVCCYLSDWKYVYDTSNSVWHNVTLLLILLVFIWTALKLETMKQILRNDHDVNTRD